MYNGKPLTVQFHYFISSFFSFVYTNISEHPSLYVDTYSCFYKMSKINKNSCEDVHDYLTKFHIAKFNMDNVFFVLKQIIDVYSSSLYESNKNIKRKTRHYYNSNKSSRHTIFKCNIIIAINIFPKPEIATQLSPKHPVKYLLNLSKYYLCSH